MPGPVIVQSRLSDGCHAGAPGPGGQLFSLPPGNLGRPGGMNAHRQAEKVRMLPVQGGGQPVGVKVDGGLDAQGDAALPQPLQQSVPVSLLRRQLAGQVPEGAVIALMTVVGMAFDDHLSPSFACRSTVSASCTPPTR